MNRFCKPRRNQKSFLAKAKRRKVKWCGLLLPALTAAAFAAAATFSTTAALAAIFAFILAFVLLPFLLFLLLRRGQGAEGDHERGVEGFGTITFQYDGNGVSDILATFTFVFLPLAIRLAGHNFLLRDVKKVNSVRRSWSAGWIEWRTAEALDQILNWRPCRWRRLRAGSRRAHSSRRRRITDAEDSPRSRRRVRRQIGRVEIIAGPAEGASGFLDQEIEVIARAMIITRTHPLRKVVESDRGRIILVGIALPVMTMDRKHLGVAGTQRVRHAEPHLDRKR